jgi:hypothetical protein
MPAKIKSNLQINQGATFRKKWIWKPGGIPVNLTGYTGRAQFKTEKGDDTPALATLTTENGGVLLGADGAVQMYIKDTDTAGYNWTDAVYDLELKAPGADGDVTRFAEGSATVDPEVTTL